MKPLYSSWVLLVLVELKLKHGLGRLWENRPLVMCVFVAVYWLFLCLIKLFCGCFLLLLSVLIILLMLKSNKSAFFFPLCCHFPFLYSSAFEFFKNRNKINTWTFWNWPKGNLWWSVLVAEWLLDIVACEGSFLSPHISCLPLHCWNSQIKKKNLLTEQSCSSTGSFYSLSPHMCHQVTEALTFDLHILVMCRKGNTKVV